MYIFTKLLLCDQLLKMCKISPFAYEWIQSNLLQQDNTEDQQPTGEGKNKVT